MNRDLLTGLISGVVAGGLIGYFIGNAHFSDEASAPVTVAAPAGAPAAIPGAMGQLDAQQRVLRAEAAVAAEPKNVEAWLSLGNDYFDLHQAQKSVAAYAKALALAPNMPMAPDILTDQGVMYRELQDFDKAIANFKQASKLNPKHQQSLYNLGIVYAQDQHKPAEALKAWNKTIEIDPASAQADQARKAIATLQGTLAKMP